MISDEVPINQDGTAPAAPAATVAAERTDRRLLEFLVCPLTKGPLVYDAARQELVSKRARLAYPIRDGVPLMTADSARLLDADP
jgi:uncharacterized protein